MSICFQHGAEKGYDFIQRDATHFLGNDRTRGVISSTWTLRLRSPRVELAEGHHLFWSTQETLYRLFGIV